MSNSKLDLELLKKTVVESLHDRASRVCEQTIVHMNEMEDAPDQKVRAMSREEVARMLSQYEQRSDPDWKNERCEDGIERVNKYSADLGADYVPADNLPKDEWTYEIQVKNGVAEDVAGDITGNTPKTDLTDLFDKAIHGGDDIEVELGDGNTIMLDPHTCQIVKNNGLLANFQGAIGSLESFAAAIGHEIHDDSSDSIAESVVASLYQRALGAIEAISEAEINKHHKKFGKLGIVDRVRGGKIQLRKNQSDAKGYKVLNGVIVKMTPEEARRRKIAGKITARRLKGMQSQMQRKRDVSLKIRANRLS